MEKFLERLKILSDLLFEPAGQSMAAIAGAAPKVQAPRDRRSAILGCGRAVRRDQPFVVLLLADEAPDNIAEVYLKRAALEQFPVCILRPRRIAPVAKTFQGGDAVSQATRGLATVTCAVATPEGKRYALGCSHVFYLEEGKPYGEYEVWHPPHRTGGRTGSRVGVLFDCTTLRKDGVTPHKLDAALCVPDDESCLLPGVRKIGGVRGIAENIEFGTHVWKCGATTGKTKGELMYDHMTFRASYDEGQFVRYDDQVGIVGRQRLLGVFKRPFADYGDSGSLVMDQHGNAVGMVVCAAEAMDLTFASPIAPVLKHFGVNIV